MEAVRRKVQVSEQLGLRGEVVAVGAVAGGGQVGQRPLRHEIVGGALHLLGGEQDVGQGVGEHEGQRYHAPEGLSRRLRLAGHAGLGSHGRSIRTTAWQSMASARPMWPTPSPVFALTLTASGRTPSRRARFARIAGFTRLNFGSCAKTVTSRLTTCQPSSVSLASVSRTNPDESAPRCAGSVSG